MKCSICGKESKKDEMLFVPPVRDASGDDVCPECIKLKEVKYETVAV